MCGSVVEHLPSTYEGLRAILSTTKGAPLQGKKHFSEQIGPAPPTDQAVVQFLLLLGSSNSLVSQVGLSPEARAGCGS